MVGKPVPQYPSRLISRIVTTSNRDELLSCINTLKEKVDMLDSACPNTGRSMVKEIISGYISTDNNIKRDVFADCLKEIKKSYFNVVNNTINNLIINNAGNKEYLAKLDNLRETLKIKDSSIEQIFETRDKSISKYLKITQTSSLSNTLPITALA